MPECSPVVISWKTNFSLVLKLKNVNIMCTHLKFRKNNRMIVNILFRKKLVSVACPLDIFWDKRILACLPLDISGKENLACLFLDILQNKRILTLLEIVKMYCHFLRFLTILKGAFNIFLSVTVC